MLNIIKRNIQIKITFNTSYNPSDFETHKTLQTLTMETNGHLEFQGIKFLHLKTTCCILHENFIYVLKLAAKSTKSRATTPNLVESRDKMPKKDKKVYCFKTKGKIAFTSLVGGKRNFIWRLGFVEGAFVITLIVIKLFFSNHVQLLLLFYYLIPIF